MHLHSRGCGNVDNMILKMKMTMAMTMTMAMAMATTMTMATTMAMTMTTMMIGIMLTVPMPMKISMTMLVLLMMITMMMTTTIILMTMMMIMVVVFFRRMIRIYFKYCPLLSQTIICSIWCSFLVVYIYTIYVTHFSTMVYPRLARAHAGPCAREPQYHRVPGYRYDQFSVLLRG